MNEVYNWVCAHWKDICVILTALVGLATVVVKLTPTQKDDNAVAKVIKVLEALSLCNADGSFVGASKPVENKPEESK
ncbi:MAG: hypothetical protein IKL48_00185 [Elusimicrobiaceae bacterium]|nr:hypothetical protein [Elusimicrobiaceae bacterium]